VDDDREMIVMIMMIVTKINGYFRNVMFSRQ
jgi:hypothetical protein